MGPKEDGRYSGFAIAPCLAFAAYGARYIYKDRERMGCWHCQCPDNALSQSFLMGTYLIYFTFLIFILIAEI